MSARPYHIPCHAHAISYTMPCTPGHAIYHAMPCLPGHTIYHAMHCQAMPYTMLCLARPYPIPCYARQAIPYAMPTRPYHMPCPPGHTIYNAMPARLYHIQSSGHNLYHAMPTRPIPCTLPCAPGHTHYHAMSRPTTTSVNHVTLARVRTVSLPDARLLVNSLVRWFAFAGQLSLCENKPG